MRHIFKPFPGIILVVSLFIYSSMPEPEQSQPVAELLYSMGEPKPAHYQETSSPDLIQRGKELVTLGRTIGPDGKQSSYISKYYVCTSCHNTVREDPDLSVVDQEARLKYARDQQIPYLQGSTFWGIVNRETWYNDDYVLKYGELVKEAEKSLKASVELCATVCAQGRSLKDWEMESILAYLWSLEMTLSDLDLSEADKKRLNGSSSDGDKIDLIKSKYLQKSPATFVDPPSDKQAGYDYEGNPALGKVIYELGCQHCHRPNGESELVLDNTDLSLNWLKRHIPENSKKSIYEIIRKGTYAEYGHQEYMPHYTLEKMSDIQVEHLRAFIENPDAASVN